MSRAGRARLRPRGVLVLAALLGVSAVALLPNRGSTDVPEGPLRPRREVVLDVLSEPDAWRVVRARPGAPPYVGRLMPARVYTLDGASRPALVLPPPAAVEFRAPDVEGGTWLDARVGFDKAVLDAARFLEVRAGLRFHVEVDGTLVWTRDLAIEGVGPDRDSEWTLVEPEQGGLLVPAGALVRVSTEFLDEHGVPGQSPHPVYAGFGTLRFERRWTAPALCSSPAAPNVVLVVMDTLRADRLSAYGYSRPTSPQLEALASRGLRVEQARSTASWTWPSTASLLTGLPALRHGVVDDTSCTLPLGLETLAEAFARAGFTTAAWSANPLIVPDKDFDQGFQSFHHGKAEMLDGAELLPEVLAWLDAVGDERFFLYVHLAAPHLPYRPSAAARALLAPDAPPDYSAMRLQELERAVEAGAGTLDELATPEEIRWIGELYDACVRTGDERLGLLLERLEQCGLTDRTLVAFTSDHGEELFDRGVGTHGRSLHRELVDVPLVLAGPGVPRGATLAGPVSNRHLARTLARLAEVHWAGGGELDLVEEQARGRGTGSLPPIRFHTAKGRWRGGAMRELVGLERDGFSLHWAPGGEFLPEALALYDRGADPGEREDLAETLPETTARLREELAHWRDEARANAASAAAGGADEETLRMLRGLGYLGD